MTPVQPTAAINGVKVLKNDGNIYKMFPTEDAQVTVEEDKMKITFHTGAKKYLMQFTSDHRRMRLRILL